MKKHNVPVNAHQLNLVTMVTKDPVSTVDEAVAVLKAAQGTEV